MLGDVLTIEIIQIIKRIKNKIPQIKNDNVSKKRKISFLKQSLNEICKKVLMNTGMQFPTVQTQLFYIKQQFGISDNLFFDLNLILKIADGNFEKEEENAHINSCINALSYFLDLLLNVTKEEYVSDSKCVNEFICNKKNATNVLRLFVLNKNDKTKTLRCRDIEAPNKIWTVKMYVENKNKIFDETFDLLWEGAQINIIDSSEQNSSVLIPDHVVIEPDYLIDASALANCNQAFACSPYLYFINKIKESVSTSHMLLGNLANYFLDELVFSNAENKTFDEVFKSSFKQMPYEFSLCKEIEEPAKFREFMEKCSTQFTNIKRTLENDFPKNGFDLNNCILEPSFFSEKYGFQGRLDLLDNSEIDGITRIVELKSGKIPWPQNDFSKIDISHMMQVAIYEMLLESVLKIPTENICSILFYSSSKKPGTNLRLSPFSKDIRSYILNMRNIVIAIEHKILIGSEFEIKELLNKIFSEASYSHPQQGRDLPDFFKEQLEETRNIYLNSSEYEKTYFIRFIQFIGRELYLLKAGSPDENKMVSISALWTTSFEDRENELELISNLTITDKGDEGQGMFIEFKKENEKDANFREGDICIIYSINDDIDGADKENILSTQVLKGTIIDIGKEKIKVYLRYKQKNESLFEGNKKWIIEHDKLDHSYMAMYKSVFSFLKASPEKKNKLMGLVGPKNINMDKTWPNQIEEVGDTELDKERKRIINKALNAEDYFLLVGPPGTGKTSVYAKNMIEELFFNTNQNILIIAYTNRAVDELCDAIHVFLNKENEECQDYIRIGTNFSCDSKYRNQLLQNIAQKCERRKELRDKIDTTRIFIGTLASVSSRLDLIKLKKFNTVIIDEASQILEPQIIGLLTMFDKFIMIGDHKQLSTISLQNEKASEISNPILKELAFSNCRESIFERFFRLLQKNNWHNNFDILKYHGRMHKEIADLINHEFYGGELQHISPRQSANLFVKNSIENNEIYGIIQNKRLCFFHQTNKDDNDEFSKMNDSEAVFAAQIAVHVYRNILNEENGKSFDPDKSIGIITPYRNQIALIKKYLKESNIPELSKIMVDTVERFQGSQRDVIIISFCFNNEFQLDNFINMTHDKTVDRKLNVALSRAREQLFLIGNWDIINKNTLYKRILGEILRC